ncbi:permease prefix domain 1-containing protein [Ruania zhangjianzhongii]|uniref:permease prefix domain 1-containing protein n=1 Tax=Ruania zhangjianzhongii TaxID=2603206 RepID=UPI0011C6F61F|nr:permease prefix domain 1-containing protein [Ruania zhangjianzhongii]
MDTTTLTERYLDAAMRTVPEAQRADLAAELRTSIEDQIEARTDAGEDPAAAERAVLEHLGDPDKLAASYTDRPLYLIGPRYFLLWWRLLKLLLWIVTPIVAFAVALGQTLAGAPVGEIVSTTWASTVGAFLLVSFWTTLVFAVIERSTATSKEDLTTPWTPDRLPEPQAYRVRLSDAVSAVVLAAITIGVIVWDQAFGLVRLGGEWHSFLHPSLWPWWSGGAVVLMVASVAVAVGAYLRHRWTYRRAAVKAILNLAIAVPVLWLMAQSRLLNSEPWLAGIPDDGAQVAQIVTILVAFGIVGVCIGDAIDAFVKARRSHRAAPPVSRSA